MLTFPFSLRDILYNSRNEPGVMASAAPFEAAAAQTLNNSNRKL
jgi:hypothetical protein